MNWVEIISLRARCGILKELPMREMKRFIDGNRDARFSGMRIFKHADHRTDISIHLGWVNGSGVPQKSELGLRLYQFLKRFGLVSHSVWVDMDLYAESGMPGTLS